MATAKASILFSLICTAVVLTVSAQDRVLTITNNCNETVRVGRTGASCGNTDTANCPLGQILNPADSTCYWDLPSPKGGPWQSWTQDLPAGETVRLVLTHPSQSCGASAEIQWNGNIWGATGCSNTKVYRNVCETAICFNGNVTQNGHCLAYQGPVGPVTRAEFNLRSNDTDFYDVTSIDGVNLPIEIKPDVSAADDYWCGSPAWWRHGSRQPQRVQLEFDPSSIPGFGDQSIPLTLVAKSVNNSDCLIARHQGMSVVPFNS